MTKQEALNELKREISVKGHMSKFQERCFEILEADLKNPTEEEVFKKFEELGYEINTWKYGVTLCKNNKFFNKYVTVITINIDLYLKCYTISLGIGACITRQEHQLLNRLFEIWGWLDEN